VKKIDFLKESMKSFGVTGTLVPSTRYVSEKMTERVDFSRDLNIVELGAGTGVITKKILSKMSANSRLFTFEVNNNFFHDLKSIKDSRLKIVIKSAEGIESFLKEEGLDKADYIISSVPLFTLPKDTTNNILTCASRSLSDEGLFIQLQYSLFLFLKIKRHFKSIKIGFTPLNYPPAFVLNCRKNNFN